MVLYMGMNGLSDSKEKRSKVMSKSINGKDQINFHEKISGRLKTMLKYHGNVNEQKQIKIHS